MMSTTTANDNRKPNYLDLQQRIDALVGKFGLEKAVEIIDNFFKNSSVGHNQTHRLKLIKNYIIGQTILVFDLDEKEFFIKETSDYREGRMASYHLLSKYTKNSHAKIASIFGKKRGTALYFIHKCNNILFIPHCYPEFVEKYKTVESNTIHFIAHLK